ERGALDPDLVGRAEEGDGDRASSQHIAFQLEAQLPLVRGALEVHPLEGVAVLLALGRVAMLVEVAREPDELSRPGVWRRLGGRGLGEARAGSEKGGGTKQSGEAARGGPARSSVHGPPWCVAGHCAGTLCPRRRAHKAAGPGFTEDLLGRAADPAKE